MLTWLTCTRGNPTERKVKTSYNSKANNLTPKYEIVKKINFIKKTKGKKNLRQQWLT
jgi:ABC-type bacteriocin/lantibiotic exporter with double-glycine peptidase domain